MSVPVQKPKRRAIEKLSSPYQTGDAQLDALLNLNPDGDIGHRDMGPLIKKAIEPLLDQPPEERGELLLFFTLLFEKIEGLDVKNKSQHIGQLRCCSEILPKLAIEGTTLGANNAEILFREGLSTLFEKYILLDCLNLMLASVQKPFSKPVVHVLEHLSGPEMSRLFEQNSNGYTAKLAMIFEVMEKANTALGNPPESGKLARSLADARRAQDRLIEEVSGSLHPVLKPALQQFFDNGNRAKNLTDALNLLQKDMMTESPEVRGEIIQNIILVQSILSTADYPVTLWGKRHFPEFNLFFFHGFSQFLLRLPDALMKRKTVLPQQTALAFLRGFGGRQITIQMDHHPSATYGTKISPVKLASTVPIARAIAAALPKGDPQIERDIRQLRAAPKYKNALLDGISRFERSGSVEALQFEAERQLAIARAEYRGGHNQNTGRQQPTPVNQPRQRKTGLLERFRGLFEPASQSADDAFPPTGRPGHRHTTRATPDFRRYVSASLHAYCAGMDVKENLHDIRRTCTTVLEQYNQNSALDPALETYADFLGFQERAADYLPDTLRGLGLDQNQYFSAKEIALVRDWIDVLDGLSEPQIMALARLMGSMYPLPNSSTPGKAWLAKIAAAVTPETEAVLEHLLMGLTPLSGETSHHSGDSFSSMHGSLSDQYAMLRSLVWVCPAVSTGLVNTLSTVTEASLSEVKGRGKMNALLGNAGMWALSKMPSGAGADALQKVGRNNNFPSSQALATKYLQEISSSAGLDKTRIEESALPDCGFANGPRKEPLKVGAAIFDYDAPTGISLVWEREDDKIGKMPSQAMRKADPEGIKRAKKRLKTLSKDINLAINWMHTLMLTPPSMAADEWKERYLGHGTLQALSQHLVWIASHNDKAVSFRPLDDGLVDVAGKTVKVDGAEIRLWHPIDADPAELKAWQKHFADAGVSQPFPQIWRGAYRAETETELDGYTSGYFITQLKFMKLGRELGWKIRHREAGKPAAHPFWFDQDRELYVEFETGLLSGKDVPIANEGYSPNKASNEIIGTGGLHFYRPEIGAKPTAAGLKKKKPLKLSEVDPRLVSELVRQAMQLIDVAEFRKRHTTQYTKLVGWMKDIGDAYLKAQDTEICLPVTVDRLKVMAAWIATGGTQDKLRIEGNQLFITGVNETYRLNLRTSQSVALDPERRCSVSPMPESPAVQGPVPHGCDDQLLHQISIAEILLRDDKLGNKRIYLSPRPKRAQ